MDPYSDAWLRLEIKKKSFRFCEKCNAVYSGGFWHRLKLSKKVLSALKKEKLRFVDCDACRGALSSRRRTEYAGELRIPRLPLKQKRDILRAINNFAAKENKRDKQARIISIDQVGQGLSVKTTPNQLAVRIGKKLNDSFKGGSLDIKYSELDYPIVVRWKPPR